MYAISEIIGGLLGAVRPPARRNSPYLPRTNPYHSDRGPILGNLLLPGYKEYEEVLLEVSSVTGGEGGAEALGPSPRERSAEEAS